MNNVRNIGVLLACSLLGAVRLVGDETTSAHYYWQAKPAGPSAELLTLFCQSCENAASNGRDIPLLAVMRDTLGDANSTNDRITDVWLLTYSRASWGKRALSAVPFFYWKVGGGAANVSTHDDKPLINLSEPQHGMAYSAARNIIQLTTLDPISMSVRASTRSYQNNAVDHERLHLEEAEGYLQAAPAGTDRHGLNQRELNTVIARLELRKRMLGGLVSARQATEMGDSANLERERVRARNWELLRQCADKTGLVFEPIDLAGAKEEYAILWFSPEETAPPAGARLGPIWKLLNVKDPYIERDKLLTAETYKRTVNGGEKDLVPLGVYSLTYPRMPLLLVDFRDGQHLRRHELTQRAINEITTGVVHLSRITNWYYFVAADVYDFYMTRRGGAMNAAERLDSYSKFRVAVALDHGLDSQLRTAIEKRANSLGVNPLEASTKSEMQAAIARYDLLNKEAGNGGRVDKRLEKERRAELARFNETLTERVRANVFHYTTLGMYTHRVGSDENFLAGLDRARRAEYYLNFLDNLAAAGTDPEVTYDSSRIVAAIQELSGLIPEIGNAATRSHAEKSIKTISALSRNETLRAECGAALEWIHSGNEMSGGLGKAGGAETLR